MNNLDRAFFAFLLAGAVMLTWLFLAVLVPMGIEQWLELIGRLK